MALARKTTVIEAQVKKNNKSKVVLKDATLREGLDTRGVAFSSREKFRIVRMLDELGVGEAEIVAPGKFWEDIEFATKLRRKAVALSASGLIYSNRSEYPQQFDACLGVLDRVDLLMPLSAKRKPVRKASKVRTLVDALGRCRVDTIEVGVGFPHATQVELGFLTEIVESAAAAGAARITLYDTNGSTDPFRVRALIEHLRSRVPTPLLFHGHNDLGMATANSFAAVLAGAAALDVTINGLGDRAGNASLEQLATLLHLRGIETGIDLGKLRRAARLVERASGVTVSKLAPVVGEFVFDHKSPSHLGVPTVFEAFDPKLIGQSRRIERSGGPAKTAGENKKIERKQT